MADFRRFGARGFRVALSCVLAVGAGLSPAAAHAGSGAQSGTHQAVSLAAHSAATQVPVGEGELGLMRDLLVANGLENQLCDAIGQMTGSLADVLVSQDFAAARCAGERAYQALSQGQNSLSQALSQGSDCVALDLEGNVIKSHEPDSSENPEALPGRWINACFSDTSIWAQRGGTMYGTTFLTSAPRQEFLERADLADVITHEYRHTLQWRLLGHAFPGSYLIAGTNACTNVFEVTAGLEYGGYNC